MSTCSLTTEDITLEVIQAWEKLQSSQPLVHCITNSVASNYVANILLATGASPAMIDNPYEAEAFAKISAALSINTGTPTTEQTQAMLIAAETAHLHQKPWVLDPVGYGPILAWRSNTVDQLLHFQPTIIRGNASEISNLAGNRVESKGVDSTLNSAEVYAQAKILLESTHCVAISGESDFIISKDLNMTIQINGGSFLQPKITATGCALGALIAAYSAVTTPTFAAISAHVHFAIAGKLAYQKTQVLGQFHSAFLDELFSLNIDKIQKNIDIKILF